MSETDVSVVPAHGGWSDGSSWSKVVAALRSEGVKAVTAPLTSLADDVAALDRMLERVEGPVVVAGNAYAGAVVASTSDERVRPHSVDYALKRKEELLWLTLHTARRTWMA